MGEPSHAFHMLFQKYPFGRFWQEVCRVWSYTGTTSHAFHMSHDLFVYQLLHLGFPRMWRHLARSTSIQDVYQNNGEPRKLFAYKTDSNCSNQPVTLFMFDTEILYRLAK